MLLGVRVLAREMDKIGFGLLIEQDIGKVLKEARKRKGLSQRELAERIGSTACNVCLMEQNKYNPTLAFLDRYSRGLGIRLEVKLWLM